MLRRAAYRATIVFFSSATRIAYLVCEEAAVAEACCSFLSTGDVCLRCNLADDSGGKTPADDGQEKLGDRRNRCG